MIVVIVLGVASRSSTIDAVLKPLLAEAKRRRSVYGLRGHLDISEGSPLDTKSDDQEPPSRDTISRFRPRFNARRHNTPGFRQRRQQSIAMPNFRSVSASDQLGQLGSMSSYANPPPRATMPARHLGHNAHLHALEASKIGDRTQQ